MELFLNKKKISFIKSFKKNGFGTFDFVKLNFGKAYGNRHLSVLYSCLS